MLWKEKNGGKIAVALGSRPTAGHIPLEDSILVRIQAPQLKAHPKKVGFSLVV